MGVKEWRRCISDRPQYREQGEIKLGLRNAISYYASYCGSLIQRGMLKSQIGRLGPHRIMCVYMKPEQIAR